MYKILVVDDEELVRKAILQKIDWQALGFLSVEEAEDGELALQAIRQNPPDVVLTDVRMPFMDGLELAHHLAEKYPDILVVMLSGHDEFEYVQKAMRSKVFEYLLKPISAAGLTDMLSRLTSQLDRTRQEKAHLLEMRNQLRQSMPLLRERFFHRLVSQPLKADELARLPLFPDLRTEASGYLVCAFQIDPPINAIFGDSPEDLELLGLSASNIIFELVGENGIVFNDTESRPVIILYGDDANDRSLALARATLLESVRTYLSQALANTWSIGIGRPVSQIGDVAQSYRDALEVLSYRLVYGGDRVYDSRDFTQPKTSFYYPAEDIQNLISRLKLEDPSLVEQDVSRLFQNLRSQGHLTADNVRILINDLINKACRTALEILADDSVDPRELYSIHGKIDQSETLVEIEPLVTEFLVDLCNRIRKQQAGHNHSLIHKAHRYIEQAYADEDLGLNEVAAHVSVSSCYLSILFKRETGETFTEYLTRVRLEKAKELLRTTDLKAYQIAAQVGYTDPHYFSLCFKKYTGMNPTQYKTGSGQKP